MKIGTKIQINETDTGVIVANHRSWKGKKIPNGYQTVRFDNDGAVMMIHTENLAVIS